MGLPRRGDARSVSAAPSRYGPGGSHSSPLRKRGWGLLSIMLVSAEKTGPRLVAARRSPSSFHRIGGTDHDYCDYSASCGLWSCPLTHWRMALGTLLLSPSQGHQEQQSQRQHGREEADEFPIRLIHLRFSQMESASRRRIVSSKSWACSLRMPFVTVTQSFRHCTVPGELDTMGRAQLAVLSKQSIDSSPIIFRDGLIDPSH